jgi:CTP:phosphocholine cytidylyltransferase-like protein/thiamine kinase-like enzyme
MITNKEFEVLSFFVKNSVKDTDKIGESIVSSLPYHVFASNKEAQRIFEHLTKEGYLINNKLSEKAYAEIAPLKVDNAVILAAGGADISAKSIYSTPKGLFVMNGETLIERQIRQLRERGIKDIYVVIGYKQELYFFLEEKWGVKLIINPDLKKNNIFSLYCAVDYLGATYICNCDNYFPENPFSAYEFESFHAVVDKKDIKDELLVKTNDAGRILKVFSEATAGECIFGHAFLNRSFSTKLKKYLHKEINNFRVTSMFWEEFLSSHIDNLDIYARKYPSNFVSEFDSIQEIQNIDELFLDNVSEVINLKICEVLKCQKEDIKNIQILQKGLTNILFTFFVFGIKYIFRYPGDSSSFFIYRKNEVRAQLLAAKAKVDNTYVYIDESGIKISKFVSNTKNINDYYYKDVELMKRIARSIRRFHDEGRGMKDWKQFNYNPIEQCERLMKEASKTKGNLFEVFSNEWTSMRKLFAYTNLDHIEKTMCHNDFNQDNCLLTDTTLDIIDWEFAGWNDPAYDFGRIIAGYDFDDSSIDQILEAYFGRPCTSTERLHWIAYIGIHCWYYVGWALYKESISESSRDWMLFFFEQAKRVIGYALPKYQEKYGVLTDTK